MATATYAKLKRKIDAFKIWAKKEVPPKKALPLKLSIKVHEDFADFVHGTLIGILIGFLLGYAIL
ncbi:MAG: hypothetical protein ACP5IJ_01765 [Candidatus Nanoarchaeia archaeon]